MPGVEAGDVETSVAQLMHKPLRHRTGFQPSLCVISRVPSYRALDPLRVGGALAAPHPGVVRAAVLAAQWIVVGCSDARVDFEPVFPYQLGKKGAPTYINAISRAVHHQES